jgi:hypothetical protein
LVFVDQRARRHAHDPIGRHAVSGVLHRNGGMRFPFEAVPAVELRLEHLDAQARERERTRPSGVCNGRRFHLSLRCTFFFLRYRFPARIFFCQHHRRRCRHGGSRRYRRSRRRYRRSRRRYWRSRRGFRRSRRGYRSSRGCSCRCSGGRLRCCCCCCCCCYRRCRRSWSCLGRRLTRPNFQRIRFVERKRDATGGRFWCGSSRSGNHRGRGLSRRIGRFGLLRRCRRKYVAHFGQRRLGLVRSTGHRKGHEAQHCDSPQHRFLTTSHLLPCPSIAPPSITTL